MTAFEQKKAIEKFVNLCDEKISFFETLKAAALEAFDMNELLADEEPEAPRRRSRKRDNSIRDRVLSTLAVAPLTTNEVLDTLVRNGWQTSAKNPRERVYRTLWNLQKQGKVFSIEDGRWAYASEVSDTAAA